MPQPPKWLLYVAPTKAGASLQAATVSQRRASVAAQKQFAYFVQNDVVVDVILKNPSLRK